MSAADEMEATMGDEAMAVEGTLVMRGDDGWYVIETDTGGRINGADVEGDADDMRQIARAIEARGLGGGRRCAVRVEGERAFLWSPRNSMSESWVPLAVADALAREIRATLGAQVGEPNAPPPVPTPAPADCKHQWAEAMRARATGVPFFPRVTLATGPVTITAPTSCPNCASEAREAERVKLRALVVRWVGAIDAAEAALCEMVDHPAWSPEWKRWRDANHAAIMEREDCEADARKLVSP